MDETSPVDSDPSISLSKFYVVVSRERIWIAILIALLGLLCVLSVAVGAVELSPGQVISILLTKIGISGIVEFSDQQATVLGVIRMPRLILGAIVGAGLGVSGAALQSLFRNPLADPALIGVSSGAALAVAAAIVLGESVFASTFIFDRSIVLPSAGFLGGLAAALFIYKIGRRSVNDTTAKMLLAGIAVNAFSGAGIGFLTFFATDAQLRNITFWTLGSMAGASWQTVAISGTVIAIATILIIRLARQMNVILLGESEAMYLGIDIERFRRRAIVLVVVAVGTGVAIVGTIGFVGLVVPHLLRMLVGADHRFLLPASALLGANLVVGADLVARTVVAPAELPIGVITALIGAPFFIWLLLKGKG